jgi:hypothetical protein
MPIHDPRQFIEEMRDHLAAHDKPLAFLFGAGTSAAINMAPPPKPGEKPSFKPLIPAINGLTEYCAKAVIGWKGRSKREAGAVEKSDTWVIDIWVWTLLSSRFS